VKEEGSLCFFATFTFPSVGRVAMNIELADENGFPFFSSSSSRFHSEKGSVPLNFLLFLLKMSANEREREWEREKRRSDSMNKKLI
jgi:hypothetical protein